MPKSENVYPTIIRDLLRYDPDSGKLFWQHRSVEWFRDAGRKAEAARNTWNGKFAGKEAFTCVQKGYLTGRILGELYRAHRVIWALMTDEWPLQHVDHINHIRSDNRWANLRAATNIENHQNMALRVNNSSGCAGVAWENRRNMWRSRIHVNGRDLHLGYFPTQAEAALARQAAVLRYGYHENHGDRR